MEKKLNNINLGRTLVAGIRTLIEKERVRSKIRNREKH